MPLITVLIVVPNLTVNFVSMSLPRQVSGPSMQLFVSAPNAKTKAGQFKLFYVMILCG
jgi:hypothetical protein